MVYDLTIGKDNDSTEERPVNIFTISFGHDTGTMYATLNGVEAVAYAQGVANAQGRSGHVVVQVWNDGERVGVVHVYAARDGEETSANSGDVTPYLNDAPKAATVRETPKRKRWVITTDGGDVIANVSAFVIAGGVAREYWNGCIVRAGEERDVYDVILHGEHVGMIVRTDA